MKPSDLCVPIYLNQQVVFDMLAMLEDGFSTLRTITTSAAEVQSQKSGVSGSVGLSNVFALLGVTLGARHDKERELGERTEERQERVHTPASLFVRLRAAIRELELHELNAPGTIERLTSGDFVEFRAVLRKNPLVDAIESFKRLADLAFLFTEGEERSGAGGGGKTGKTKHGKSTNDLILKQLDGLLGDLTATGTLDLIAELLNVPDAKAVLSTRLDYFLDRAVSEIADGEFFVLGKVVRIARSLDDSINLLRKTSFGRLKREILEQLTGSFAGAEKAGLNLPEIITEIPGPALQVFPIAVFL